MNMLYTDFVCVSLVRSRGVLVWFSTSISHSFHHLLFAMDFSHFFFLTPALRTLCARGRCINSNIIDSTIIVAIVLMCLPFTPWYDDSRGAYVSICDETHCSPCFLFSLFFLHSTLLYLLLLLLFKFSTFTRWNCCCWCFFKTNCSFNFSFLHIDHTDIFFVQPFDNKANSISDARKMQKKIWMTEMLLKNYFSIVLRLLP